jgi:hypothetical protein
MEFQVELSAARAMWRGASRHHLGQGLEEGIPSFRAAREARKWLVRHHCAAEVKALDNVVCGGIWCGGREHIRRRCRCGQQETPWHRYYECSLLDNIRDQRGKDIIGTTRWLADVFRGDLEKYHCLWGRAIIPWELCNEGPAITAEQAKEGAFSTPGFSRLLETEGVGYSDGSGGPNHAPKAAPVAGSGLAVLKWEGAEGGRRRVWPRRAPEEEPRCASTPTQRTL